MKKSLKELIQDKGIKIICVAKKIGVSQPLLTMKLNGNATMDDTTKEKILQALNIDVNEIIL